ncbi:MAG: VanZ family protein [Candidatus Omnitrophica bacterium]|nr:VanZ family protein [Candidatus Omnitrophota bacterium]
MPANNIDPGFKKFTKYWLVLLLWLGVIFYFSSLPGKDIPALFPLQDILFHAVTYAVLAYLFIRALKNTCPGLARPKLILFTFVFGVIYGLSDEFHQSFVPGRQASAFDLFVDSVSCFIGSFFY